MSGPAGTSVSIRDSAPAAPVKPPIQPTSESPSKFKYLILAIIGLAAVTFGALVITGDIAINHEFFASPVYGQYYIAGLGVVMTVAATFFGCRGCPQPATPPPPSRATAAQAAAAAVADVEGTKASPAHGNGHGSSGGGAVPHGRARDHGGATGRGGGLANISVGVGAGAATGSAAGGARALPSNVSFT